MWFFSWPQNNSVLDYQTGAWASVSSIRILKTWQAGCYRSVNNLECNPCYQLEAVYCLNLVFRYMNNKENELQNHQKDDAS